MGANEHGVCIGNEAVYSKVPYDTRPLALTGLDLVRFVFCILLIRNKKLNFSTFSLALQRAKTAKLAVEIIGELVVKYGQGGVCYDPMSNLASGYDNSFLIVDSEEAWTIETSDHVWVAKQIKGNIFIILCFNLTFCSIY